MSNLRFRAMTGVRQGSSKFHTLTPAVGTVKPGLTYTAYVEVVSNDDPQSRGIISLLGAGGVGTLVSFPAAVGKHTGSFTSNSPSSFSPVLYAAMSASDNYTMEIKHLRVYEHPDSYTPAEIDPITFTGFVGEIMRRGDIDQSKWSRADALKIDSESRYKGIGWHTTKQVTLRQAINDVLPSYGVAAWVDRAGVIRFTRLTIPDSPTVDIVESDILADVRLTQDQAPNLTASAGYRPNWTVLSETDIVTNYVTVPIPVRQALTAEYQGVVQSSVQLSPTYSHAISGDTLPMLHDRRQDAAEEVDRVMGMYQVPRFFYTVEVRRMRDVDIGTVARLTYPKYGLQAGKPLLVTALIDRPIDGTMRLTLWG